MEKIMEAIKAYQEAVNAYREAEKAAETAANDAIWRKMPPEVKEARQARLKDPDTREAEKADNDKREEVLAAAEYNEEVAGIVCKVCAEKIRREVIREAAEKLPAIMAKYQGKAAGPKTREKACNEIMSEIPVKYAYFGGPYSGAEYCDRIIATLEAPGTYNGIVVEIVATSGGKYGEIINKENKFEAGQEWSVPTGEEPESPEEWAKQFIKARNDLEEKARQTEKKFTEIRNKWRFGVELPIYTVKKYNEGGLYHA